MDLVLQFGFYMRKLKYICARKYSGKMRTGHLGQEEDTRKLITKVRGKMYRTRVLYYYCSPVRG